jgi:hypothetical protein
MEKKISRRDLLKGFIAGSGGIVAAGFVPEKWLKPVVKSGVLPVHAQASAPDHNYVRGGGDLSEYLYGDYRIVAAAFVSSADFSFPGIPFVKEISPLKLASPKKFSPPKVDFPIEGEEVTLYIDGQKYEPSSDSDPNPKQTDEKGYVSWSIMHRGEENGLEDTQIVGPPPPVPSSVTLKFEIFGHFDEVTVLRNEYN